MMAELRSMSLKNGNRMWLSEESGQQGPSNRVNSSFRKGSYQLESEEQNEHIIEGNGDTPAVVIRNACKHYKKNVPVLQNFCMTIPKGAIYSLLGSSGCGKSTTLSCIVGVRKLNAGNIHVFGANPGVNGKMVGFMPQETSLYYDFSIAETLAYFGTLSGMEREAARKGSASLTQLLRLPDSSQRVGTLSGGEQRRVSFAVALIHGPDLLILDEPTAGVDPLLRETIWNHLVYLSQERGVTILMTSHHIHEANNSTMVGVMRHGRLAVEQSPTTLLRQFNTSSLEIVVLKLCQNELQTGEPDAHGRSGRNIAQLDIDAPDETAYTPSKEISYQNTKISDSVYRVRALIHKNLVILFRNLLLFTFSILIPALVILVMCIAFKDDPKNLDFGVVNYEASNASLCTTRRVQGECDVENLSCKFLNNIKPGVLNLENYETEEDAIKAVQTGKNWGFLKFPRDYSAIFYERISNGANVDKDVLINAEIIVRMDQSTKSVYGKIKAVLHDAFEDYAKSILNDCGFDERQAEFPLQYGIPIFGTDDTKYIEFVAPSISVVWLFFFPIIAASIRYINERKQGTFDRSLVASTKVWEILFSYTATECITLVLQSGLVFVILTVVVGIELLGSHAQVMVLLFLSSFGGVSMGLFLGTLVNEEIEAALLDMALFFPNVFISGAIWPSEGSPLVMQHIAYFLPCTLTAESIRSVFSRGLPFSHPNVWPGYVSILGWILLFFGLTIIVQHFKNK